MYAKQTNGSEETGKQQTVLECHASVDSRLNFRSAGMDSEALAKLKHKNQQQSTKGSRIQVYAIADDPERVQLQREKEAKARAKMRNGSGSSRMRRPRVAQSDGLLYDEANVSALKSMKYDDDSDGAGSDDSFIAKDSDEEERADLHGKRSAAFSDDDGEGAVVGSDSDSDDGNGGPQRRGVKKRRAGVLDDE